MIPLFKVFTAPTAAERVAEVLASGYTAQGPVVEMFETMLKDYLGEQSLLTVSSGTAALDLACHLAGVGPGTEVISTPQTCSATNGVIANRGAKIIWADIDPLTGNIDPASVAKLVNEKTVAVMAVDWSGRLCGYKAIREALRGDIWIIRDAAHGFGTVDKNADFTCWSFQAIKHLSTGDGGLLLVPPSQYERARKLRWFGLDRTKGESFRCAQDIEEVGYKYHMNDVAAAIGCANFTAGFAKWVEVDGSTFQARYGEIDILGRHRENARLLLDGLTRIQDAVSYDFANAPPFDPTSAYWVLTILVPHERDELQAFLASRGIGSSRVHRCNDEHTAFKRVSEWRVPHPGLDAFDAAQLSIPCGWWVGEHERNTILMALFDFAEQQKRGA